MTGLALAVGNSNNRSNGTLSAQPSNFSSKSVLSVPYNVQMLTMVNAGNCALASGKCSAIPLPWPVAS